MMERPRLTDATGGAYFATPTTAVEFIPSGSKLLDCVLGGGWALGRIGNIVGDKSVGKSLLAIEACANYARMYDGKIWYNEAESAFDTAYAETLGLPKKRVQMLEHCPTVEEFFKHLEKCTKSVKDGATGLYILDSLDALSDSAEMDRDIGDSSYGAQKAKKMSELFRRINSQLSVKRIHLMIVSQVRDAIGVAFGDKHKRSGGKALDFYASQVLYMAHIGSIKTTLNKIQRVTGIEVRAKCKKNKIALPMRECDFRIRFGYGVDDIGAALAWLESVGAKDKVNVFNHRLKRAATLEQEQAVRADVDEFVVERWYAIEKSFLPERGKYA